MQSLIDFVLSGRVWSLILMLAVALHVQFSSRHLDHHGAAIAMLLGAIDVVRLTWFTLKIAVPISLVIGAIAAAGWLGAISYG